MKAVEFIDQKIKALFKRYLEEDFEIETELMKEAGYREEEIKKSGLSKSFSSSFFSILIEKLYSLCLKEGKIISSSYLIKNLPKNAGLSIGDLSDLKSKKDISQIFEGVLLHKDVFFRVLEVLKLVKTKQTYVNWLIINENDEDFDPKHYLSTNQIKKYSKGYVINDIFSEEYEEKKLSNNRVIVLK